MESSILFPYMSMIISINVVKQCHKPPIWKWFISLIYHGDLEDGLWHCFTHKKIVFYSSALGFYEHL